MHHPLTTINDDRYILRLQCHNKKTSHSQDQRHHKYIELDIEIPHPIRGGQYEGRPKDFETLCIIMLEGQGGFSYGQVRVFKRG